MKITKKKIVALLLVGAGAYAIYSFNAGKGVVEEKSYVIGTVERGTIINSVSGTGQVAAYDGGDIKPSVSGKLTYLNIKEGDTVKKGQLIATIDMTDAKKAVSDAETSVNP
ncbi:MAG: Macrolide export protein MacA [Parcubacteria group bacterium ADurb.Bin216]|nr:MAG: Macrolide export protein MacA [Parcubacteria group bacterium ADurb.Bin216]